MRFKIQWTEVVEYSEEIEIPDEHVEAARKSGASDLDTGLPWAWFDYSTEPECRGVDARDVEDVQIIPTAKVSR